MDLAAYLASVEAAVADADADLVTDLGDYHDQTSARLWRHQVLVDWEPDPQAGGCLLRPTLLRRLIALHAQVDVAQQGRLRIRAQGRIVASLSDEHAALVARLGGARRVEMQATLRFDETGYLGGQEIYYLVERGKRLPLLQLRADVRSRPVRAASPHTLPTPT